MRHAFASSLLLAAAAAGCAPGPAPAFATRDQTTPMQLDASARTSLQSELPAPVHAVSRDDIVDHIADRHRVRWTKAATLMLHGTQACIDGRDAHAIIGTPGGDAGELVLALATAERLHGRPFTPDEIARIFDAYLEAFGHFYMHSDDHAVAALLERLRVEHPGAALPSPTDHDALAQFMQSPPPELRETILELLADPSFVGCGHLRMMLLHADAYGVRAELVGEVLRNFHRDLWAGHLATDFVVLEGRHHESAVLTVELEHEVHTYTRIPLVSPRVDDTEIFVLHPDVAHFVRRENAAFLLEQIPLLHERVDEAAFYEELDHLADLQMTETLARLAPDLPRFRAIFAGNDFELVGPDAPPIASGPTEK
jgi:hypothetical protein